ncbi:hypothetical protein ACKP2L_04990 [Oenococcus alcoholitolerans]|uniref:hypothetical protein n=1 Tax=Oenococcus alcoholitolerans TaxID=931074 RepID=UPI003F720038
MRLKNSEWTKVFLLFTIIALFSISPIINHQQFIVGSDTAFHMNRIFDSAMQIKHHNIQYFISMYGYQANARIVNPLYSPIWIYGFGLILDILKSWLSFQIASDLIFALISQLSMYYLLRENKIEEKLSIFLSIFYYSTISGSYIIENSFNGLAAAILPLGISVCVRYITNSNKPVKIVELTLATSLMIQTHILTTLFLISIYILSFFIFLIQNRENYQKIYLALKNTLVAGILTLLLTFNVWGSFLEIYLSNKHIIKPFIRNDYAFTGELFNIDSVTNGAWRTIGLLFSIVVVFQASYLIINWHKTNFKNKFVSILGFIFLLLDTNFFPWSILWSKIPFMRDVQLVNRFGFIAKPFIIFAFALTITNLIKEKRNKNFLILPISFALLSIIFNTSAIEKVTQQILGKPAVVTPYKVNLEDYTNNKIFRTKKLQKAVNKMKDGTIDYMPGKIDDDIPSQYNRAMYFDTNILNNKKNSKKFIKTTKNNKLNYMFTAKKINKQVMIPAIKYGHSIIRLNGKIINPRLTPIGSIIITPQKRKNMLQISYSPSAFWKIGMIIWILSIIVCSYLLINNKKYALLQ